MHEIILFLDDVNKFEQFEYLAGGFDRFSFGSRIIITTRDKQVLYEYGVCNIYEAEEFNYYKSLELFYKYTLKENRHYQEFIVLLDGVVDYGKGNLYSS